MAHKLRKKHSVFTSLVLVLLASFLSFSPLQGRDAEKLPAGLAHSARLSAPSADTLTECRAPEETGRIGVSGRANINPLREQARYKSLYGQTLVALVFFTVPFYFAACTAFFCGSSHMPVQNRNINYIHSIDGKKKGAFCDIATIK